MRLICGLRQIDVWAGTGIPVSKLSAAEQGRIQLTAPEKALLVSYLTEKWKAIQDSERERDGQAHGWFRLVSEPSGRANK